jgi:mannose-6-phosphate isomerase-like protein (cupin superfamily)
MKEIAAVIESGIIETYILGNATVEEAARVESMAALHIEVKQEMDSISEALEAYAMANSVAPPLTVKPFLMAMLDYTERMENGEIQSAPPILNDSSKVADYAQWLDRKDLVLTDNFEGVYAKIIGYTPKAVSAIVWIQDAAPNEVHDDEFEKFLIVEGTCDIIIGDEVHHLVPGDYLSIPLYKSHMVKVTSSIPCKVILQRIAA